MLDIFEDPVWQMSLGERAAVEGVLTHLKPAVAIEIGSMEGACLVRIAAHAQEVHSFDLTAPTLPMPVNVRLHTGNSHELLPRVLAQLAEQHRNVDFAIVDGDHSSKGVRQDIEDLLNSKAVASSVILIHDTANEEVRHGVEAVHFAAWPKVSHVDLDWVPGHLFAEPALRNELWYGLGLVVVESSRMAYFDGPVFEQRYQPAAHLLSQARDLVVARQRVPPGTESEDDPSVARARIALLEAELGERLSVREVTAALQADVLLARRRIAELESELETLGRHHDRAERALEDIKGSPSWRMTEPLRAAKRLARPRPR